MKNYIQQTNAQRMKAEAEHQDEQGFILLGLIVAIAIILMVLGAAATEVAFSLRREREVESARRADQYVRAIRRFYLKNQHYPGSLEQLENTNRVRYLRQRYVDPLTGKADYRLILVGQNQTTVKGFFGEPLAGLATTGLGSAAGMQSPGMGGPTAGGGFAVAAGTNPNGAAGTFGSTGTTTGATGTAGNNGAAGTAGTSGATGTAGTSGTAGAAGTTDPANGAPGATSGLPGSVGPFMGVGSSASGSSLIVVNEQTTYETWEFLYDPRLEKLRQAAALNAGAGSAGAGALGTTQGAFGNTNGTNPTNTTTPPGNNGGNPPGSKPPQP
ncbi:MAG: type II secretion system GspH family protein [Acidobacteriota bacterium]|nr:type II secretion system GspH family protein [Acidobacteriota bacterium]